MEPNSLAISVSAVHRFRRRPVLWDQVQQSPPAGLAVVLGGFKGLSSRAFEAKGYRVVSFEPVPSFAEEIRNLAKRESLDIEVIEAAASDSEGELALEEKGEQTSQLDSSSSVKGAVVVQKVDFANWVRGCGLEIDILEMNIEGSEFDVLPRLLESEEIKSIVRLNIQFHKVSSDSQFLQQAIREALAKTHNLLWSFDWLWEAWERKPELGKSKPG